MPKIRATKFESPSARLTLPVQTKPFWLRIARGIKLGYRRNATGGTWSVEATDGHGKEWIRKFAEADDHDKADGQTILTFWQAQDRAKEIARGQTPGGQGAPVTVERALARYELDLKSAGADPANAKRVRAHLSPVLAGKCVAVLTAQDLRAFRDGIVDKGGNPNRTMKGLRAALNAAAKCDSRITNAMAWKLGLESLPEGNTARRLTLPDRDVRAIIVEARAIGACFGLLVEVLAATGARISQVARLRVSDLQAAKGRLLMSPSRKGGRRAAARKAPAKALQIPGSLAGLLQGVAGGRADDELLLLSPTGRPWSHDNIEDPFSKAVIAAGLDPSITSYALRHSSIVRGLVAGLPVSLVASLHDTSDSQIRAHYGRYITDVTDDLVRAAMVDLSPAAIIPFVRQA
jgi:integrase